MAAKLDIVIGAVDKASGTLDKIGGKMKGVLRAGALAGGAAVAGIGIAAVKMGMDFEKGFAEVKTLLPDVSEKAFGAMRSDLLDLSKEMGVATDQALPALYQAVSAGVPKENVMTFMETASKAAIGGVTDLETAVDGITSVTNAYAAQNISAEKAADIMFTTVKLGKTNFEQLSASLFQVNPIAAATGVKFEEVSAGLAALTAQGVPTAQATTQLAAAMQSLTMPTTRQQAAAEKLGVTLNKEAVQTKGLQEVMFELLEATEGDEAALRKLLGSAEAVKAVFAITAEGGEKYASALEEMENASGAVDTAFETMSDTASFKLNKALNLLKVTLTEVGIKIIPYVTKALERVTPWLERNLPRAIEKIERFVRDARPTVEALFGTFREGLRVVAPLVADLVMFIVTNKPILIAAVVAIGAAIVLAFGPVATAMVALTALILIVGLISQHWEEWRDKMVEIVNDLVDGVMAPIEDVVGWLENNWKKIVAVALAVLFPPGAGLFLIVTNFGTIKAKVVGVIAGVRDWLAANWKKIVQVALAVLFPPGAGLFWIVTHFGTIKAKVRGIVGEIVGFITGIPGRIGSYGQTFYNAAKGLFNRLANGAIAGINEIPRAIVNGLNSLARVWNDFSFSFGGVKVAGQTVIPSFRIDTPNIPAIPYPPPIPSLQRGGVVERTGLAVVHEGERFTRAGAAVNIYGDITVVTQNPEDFIRQLRRYASA